MSNHIFIVIALQCVCMSALAQVKKELDTTVRTLRHNQKEVLTTYDVAEKFVGKYTGRKSGYLQLNKDGTGAYRYDYQVFLPDNCEEGEIPILWGFILDDEGRVLKFERDYGYSYPVIYKANGANSFQGCSRTSLVDYLLVYKDGTIEVSSSDDWKKVD